GRGGGGGVRGGGGWGGGGGGAGGAGPGASLPAIWRTWLAMALILASARHARPCAGRAATAARDPRLSCTRQGVDGGDNRRRLGGSPGHDGDSSFASLQHPQLNAMPPGVITALARRAEWHWMLTATGFIVRGAAAAS